jgi:prepilin-type N-terminal cleavage/methylation domain-containing protein/prepilin-type processing-associated H-X9-DG protein
MRAKVCDLRRGFTITELLVVIGVIGLLLAILVPAVMRVRETSRKALCQSRLAGLGKALHAFEASRQAFPPAAPYAPGRRNAVGAERQFAPHVALLPFVEQAPLAERVAAIPTEPGAMLAEGSESSRGVSEIAFAVVESFVCPSDSGGSGTNYRVCLGPSPAWIESSLSPDGGQGPFTALVEYRPGDFTDGLGNTVGMSEKIKAGGGSAWDEQADFWYTGLSNLDPVNPPADEMTKVCGSLTGEPTHFHAHPGRTWMFASYAFTWYNHVSSPNAPTPDCTVLAWPGREASNAGSYKASSRHSGGVNALMMDGAVRFVADEVDLAVWRAAATRAGGEPAGF